MNHSLAVDPLPATMTTAVKGPSPSAFIKVSSMVVSSSCLETFAAFIAFSLSIVVTNPVVSSTVCWAGAPVRTRCQRRWWPGTHTSSPPTWRSSLA